MLSVQGASRGCARPRCTSRACFSKIVADAFGLIPDELTGSTRGRAHVALARQIGMYLARVWLGLTLAEAAAMFGRDRTTAAYACRVIEDRRDDPCFDAELTAIEVTLARRLEPRR